MDNFEIFNEKDRKDISYGACVAGSSNIMSHMRAAMQTAGGSFRSGALRKE